ncbi:MAG TPA: SRPBCC family protein [Candidatus Dormibacteraeota bacterium]|nr:SRPBCC family protein [Candidatus Dormibacteraeota bacterium]
MQQRLPVARFSRTCAAPPEVVYDMLADLRSHLRWGGAKQRADFRLLSLNAPDGPASVGTIFATTGTIPMSGKRWEDSSTVCEAVRPSTFEFVTQGKVGSGPKAMMARYAHRYELAPVEGGSTVTYTMTQQQITNPFLRLALPVIRQMMWRVGIPMFAGRGFRNLLEDAEATARAHPVPHDAPAGRAVKLGG